MNKKFRFWSKDKNKFINLPSVWVNWGGELMAGQDNTVIIQQFTGLKDKNGVEIFEGDIVTWTNDELEGEVKYDNEMACFVISYDIDAFVYLSDFPLTLKIKGNIYERPINN